MSLTYLFNILDIFIQYIYYVILLKSLISRPQLHILLLIIELSLQYSNKLV